MNHFARMILLYCFAVGSIGCGPGFQSVTNSEHNSFSFSSKLDCQYIGAEALSDRLISHLQIETGDVPVLNTNGVPTNTMRIESNKDLLGVADPSKGKFADYSCEIIKFRISAEVMIDACETALANQSVRQQLFPSGIQNFDSLFLSFLGRLPRQEEIQVLQYLAMSFPEEKQPGALCAAAAMSFEALTRI